MMALSTWTHELPAHPVSDAYWCSCQKSSYALPMHYATVRPRRLVVVVIEVVIIIIVRFSLKEK